MPAPTDEPDQKRLPRVVGGEGGGKQRRQRRDRAVHQSSEARLHVLQQEHAPRGFVLLGASAGRQDLLAELVGQAFVLRLGLGEFDQEPAHRGVARRVPGAPVESSGGVLAGGTNSAYQDDTSKPGNPGLRNGRSSGAVGKRFSVVTASPRSCPERTVCSREPVVLIAESTRRTL